MEEKKELVLGGAYKLENGNYLYNDHGKYNSGLTWVLTKEDIKNLSDRTIKEWKDTYSIRFDLIYNEKISARELNLGNFDFDAVRGRYWVSPKGNHCFQPIPNGPHILLKEDWKGHGKGVLKSQKGLIYHRRASSNGGGTGYTYVVVSKGWFHKIETGEYEDSELLKKLKNIGPVIGNDHTPEPSIYEILLQYYSLTLEDSSKYTDYANKYLDGWLKKYEY